MNLLNVWQKKRKETGTYEYNKVGVQMNEQTDCAHSFSSRQYDFGSFEQIYADISVFFFFFEIMNGYFVVAKFR